MINVKNFIKGSLISAATSMYMKKYHKSAIDIFFKNKDEEIKIPINPPDLTITQNYANTTAEIVALGEVNILGEPQLQELTIESFFPYDDNHPYADPEQEKTPEELVEFFKEAAKDKKPLKMTVTRMNISMLVSVESFDRKNQSGDHDDIYYTMKLKEYRLYGAMRIEFEKNNDGSIKTDSKGNWIAKDQSTTSFSSDALSGDKVIPAEVVNTEKGNIAAVAKKHTGEWGNWKKILDENKNKLTDVLGDFVGEKLKIPEVLRDVLKNNLPKF
ncbi:MAG: hypothetical protein RR420_05545 [Anaerovoracaceae bacterium]